MVLPRQGIDAILGMNWLRLYGVVLELKRRIVELKLPSSEDRMSLLMPSDFALLVLLILKLLLLSLLLFPWSVSFRMSFLKIYLGYHLIGMWSYH
jgi:hypothetical protein